MRVANLTLEVIYDEDKITLDSIIEALEEAICHAAGHAPDGVEVGNLEVSIDMEAEVS